MVNSHQSVKMCLQSKQKGKEEKNEKKGGGWGWGGGGGELRFSALFGVENSAVNLY